MCILGKVIKSVFLNPVTQQLSILLPLYCNYSSPLTHCCVQCRGDSRSKSAQVWGQAVLHSWNSKPGGHSTTRTRQKFHNYIMWKNNRLVQKLKKNQGNYTWTLSDIFFCSTLLWCIVTALRIVYDLTYICLCVQICQCLSQRHIYTMAVHQLWAVHQSKLVLPGNIILHRLVHDQSIVKDSDSTPTHFFGMRIWTHAGA